MPSLFKLIDAADEVVADNYEVDDIHVTEKSRGLLSCGGDIRSYFTDQEVEYEGGVALATSVCGHEVALSFYMVTKRQVVIEDLSQ